ncbi:MAG: SDR family NAD(P)-dependent oxidoreductase [Bacteroidales bacterium]|nr:SDR family NAD(P)-dependent oxidoreductase [Bacteroidales bacterium]
MSAAFRLLAAGNTVYAAARRMERMTALRDAGAILLQMDVTDDAALEKGVARVIAEQGRIDILINNAGYGSFGPLETVPEEEARRQFDVNVFGLARLTQLVLPYMREKGSGRIINVASMAGHFCEPRGDWYHATKYAVVGLSECLRMEVRDFGIKVVLIEPGAIRSEWSTIAMNNLEAVTEGTAYEEGSRRQAKLFKWAYSHLASSPEKVSKAIFKAATAPRPRLSYRMGLGSHATRALKAVLPARAFDSMMIKVFG